ncbi:MAG: murB [Bacillota bacterium]|jgi:UDP-N-acetylmuramate dehydrogenase|nr:murB [Bacillota bacterium]
MEHNNIINEFYNEIILNINSEVIKNELLKKHTYFKIGGPADLFFEPENAEELKTILNLIKKYNINYYIIGNGTNLLISDEGFKGAIIKIGEKFNYIKIVDNKITVGAGTLLSVIAKQVAKLSLTNFEFASGIPGYIGGAVAMNAGAYNGELKNVVSKVKCMDSSGKEYEFSNEEMNFGYRHSKVTDSDLIVLEAEIVLQHGIQQDIDDRMKDLNERRITKQPLNLPSAGSTFKRPENGYASKLIEDAGLKGLKYKGAMVSDKHSGFVVNYDNACCEDVLELMRIVIRTVEDKFGIILEPEIKIIGTKL